MTGFYKMGTRYYRPELMRWSQQDPVEQPTDAVQANRYGYAGDDPINQTDPQDSGRHPGTTKACARRMGSTRDAPLGYPPPHDTSWDVSGVGAAAVGAVVGCIKGPTIGPGFLKVAGKIVKVTPAGRAGSCISGAIQGAGHSGG